MDSTHSILFHGEILAGHPPELVHRRLQALLKCPDDTLNAIFSGQEVTLRRGLPSTEAERYQRHLTGMGMRVEVQPPLPTAETARDDARVDAAETPAAALAAEEMTCPQCGEKQPRRNLCRVCSVDMPRLLAAQQANAEEARRQREQEQQERLPAPRNTRRPPGIDVHADTDAKETSRDSRLFSLDCGGRMGRGTFALAGGLSWMAFALTGYFTLRNASFLLAGGLLLVLVAYSMRLTILRLHDLGRSGWWVLLQFLPYLNALSSLALLFAPGQKDTNAWGAKPRSHGIFGAIVGVLATIGAVVVIGMSAATLDDLPSVKSLITAHENDDDDGNTAADAAFMARYDARRDRIEMFSLSTCGYCAEKRRLFERMGVRYTEYIIDTDPAAEARLEQRLRSAGLSSSDALGTPIIDVNGTFLPNNPDLEEIARHLSGATRL